MSLDGAPASPLREAVITALVVTALVTVVSTFSPPRYVGSAVAAIFLGATWVQVFRRDDRAVVRAGLAFGGLVLPDPLDARRLARELGRAFAWALLASFVFFAPFYFGFRFYAQHVWHAVPAGLPPMAPPSMINELVGQVALIALPEEVFYRGYLQTKLDEAWPPTLGFLGATVGPALPVTSAVFALGHLLTIHDPARLAVFFPSLVFGWLRARTGGVGASILFHASCNLLSATLLQAYGPH